MTCKAKTKSGKRCKNTPQEGSEFCHIESHREQESVDKIRHPKKAAMIEALESTLGVVTTACKKVGINRQTHYNWLKDDELYVRHVNEIADVALDFAESQLFKRMKDNDTTSVIFYLKTKGRGRGYIERKEHDFRMKTEDWDWDENGDPREYVQQEVSG